MRNEKCNHPQCIQGGAVANFDDEKCWIGEDMTFCSIPCKEDYIKNHKSKITRRRQRLNRHSVALHRYRRKLAEDLSDLIYEIAEVEVEVKVLITIIRRLDLSSPLFSKPL